MQSFAPELNKKNNESPLSNHGSLENCKKVVELFEQGLTARESSLAYHATSLEALQLIIKEGALPACARQGDRLNGTISFFPNPKFFQDHHLAKTFKKWKEPNNKGVKNGLETYGGALAKDYYIASQLGLDMKLAEHNTVINALSDPSIENAFQTAATLSEMSVERVKMIYAKSEARKGVILLFSSELQNQCQISDGDINEGDLKFHVPNGISIDSIVGIEALGDVEYDFLDSLGSLVEVAEDNSVFQDLDSSF